FKTAESPLIARTKASAPGLAESGQTRPNLVRDPIHQLLHRVICLVHSFVASVACMLFSVRFEGVGDAVHRISDRRISLCASLCLLICPSRRSSTAIEAHVFNINVAID